MMLNRRTLIGALAGGAIADLGRSAGAQQSVAGALDAFVSVDDFPSPQAALDAALNVRFSSKTYVLEELRPREGAVLLFDDTVLVFPRAPSRQSLILLGGGSGSSAMGPYRMVGRLTLASEFGAGKLLRGIYLLGARDVDLSALAISGAGFDDGYLVHIAASYAARPVNSQSVSVANVTSRGGWGAVAATGCDGLIASNLEAVGGDEAALVLETDVGRGRVSNVVASGLRGRNGANALHCVAHDGSIEDVFARDLSVSDVDDSVTLVRLSHVAGGRIDRIRLERGRQSGGRSCIYSPNNTLVPDLTIRDFTASGCIESGYRVTSGGLKERVVAERCGENGYRNAHMDRPAAVEDVLRDCRFSDNNQRREVNGSGVRAEHVASLVVADSRLGPGAHQAYGLYFAGQKGARVRLTNNDMSGNQKAPHLIVSPARLIAS